MCNPHLRFEACRIKLPTCSREATFHPKSQQPARRDLNRRVRPTVDIPPIMGELPELAEIGTAGLGCPTATSRRSFMGIANGSRPPQAAVMRPQRLQPESTQVRHRSAYQQIPEADVQRCTTPRALRALRAHSGRARSSQRQTSSLRGPNSGQRISIRPACPCRLAVRPFRRCCHCCQCSRQV
jgi:hypothetical protein